MNDGWSFETRQIHAGQTADADHRRPRPADLPDHVVRVQRHRARGEPVRAQGVRQHLHADHEPDAGRRRAARGQPRGRRRRRCSWPAASPPRRSRILNIAEAGDHIVASPSLYGGTYNLLHYTCPSSASQVTFVEDPDDLASWQAAVRPEHQGVLRRDHRQPEAGRARHRGRRRRRARGRRAADRRQHRGHAVPDPPARVGRRHRRALGDQVPRRPRHRRSAASSSTAASSTSPQDPERFPNFNQPDPSYHGLVYARDLGVGSALGANLAFILKARVQLLRDLGPAASPFNAFLIAQGLETLSLRIERHVQNAQAVAPWLEGRDEVESVAYAGLASSPWHALRRASTRPKGPAPCWPSRSTAGSRPGKRFVEALELHSHVANIGDVRSLVIHPASTTHSQLTEEEQAATRRHARAGPARGRHRAHRRHPGRPGGRASARPRSA